MTYTFSFNEKYCSEKHIALYEEKFASLGKVIKLPNERSSKQYCVKTEKVLPQSIMDLLSMWGIHITIGSRTKLKETTESNKMFKIFYNNQIYPYEVYEFLTQIYSPQEFETFVPSEDYAIKIEELYIEIINTVDEALNRNNDWIVIKPIKEKESILIGI